MISLVRKTLPRTFFLIWSGVFLFLLLFLSLPLNFVSAASCGQDKAAIRVVTRDFNDAIVKNIRWELYKQIYDADGRPVAGEKVGSSNTGDTAFSTITFDPFQYAGDSGDFNFAIKVYDVNPNAGEFWYWSINLPCGVFVSHTAKMSSIRVILRDKDGNALKKRTFALYTQKKDIDGNPIIDETVSANLSTGDEGVKRIFVSRGNYIIKIPAIDNKFTYTKYDIEVNSFRETVFDYSLSNVTVSIRDGSGALMVNTAFEVFVQERDADGFFILGKKVGSYNTGPNGITGIFLPTGSYAFQFTGSAGQKYTLWNQNINESESTVVDYRLSNVNITVRDGRGDLLKNWKFDVYKQETDADGNIIFGDHLGQYHTGETGVANIFLPSGAYIFQFQGSGKEKITLNNQLIDSSTTSNINFLLGTFKLVVTGVDGALLKDIPVTFYRQDYDEHSTPIRGAKITTENTGENGSVIFYAPEGKYVVDLKGPDGYSYTLWEQEIKTSAFSERKYERKYTMSAFNIFIRSQKNDLIKEIPVEIYNQKYDADGNPILGEKIGTKTTNDTGRAEIYLPKGTYAIVVPSSVKNWNHFFWERNIYEEWTTKMTLYLSALRVISKDAEGKKVKNIQGTISTQKLDIEGNPILNTKLFTFHTGEAGFQDIYLPEGVYAITVGEKSRFNIVVRKYLTTSAEIIVFPGEESPEYEFGDVIVPPAVGNRPDGTLIKSAGDPRVYVLENGEKRHITTPDVFRYLGYDWRAVHTVSDIELNVYPEGVPLTPDIIRRPDGTLIKGTESPAVYLIEGGKKRPIKNERVFLTRGYHWKDILVVVDAQLEEIALGALIDFDPSDVDFDGLDALEEERYGTDPQDDDSDDDGYLDGEEVNNGYNPSGPGRLPSPLIY